MKTRPIHAGFSGAVMLLMGWSTASWAGLNADPRSSREIPAVRFESVPIIDGELDDACWKQAPVATGFVHRSTGEPMSDRTEARIGYDDKAIYVSFRCWDERPADLIGREIQPGSEFNGEDAVEVDIDPFFTRQSAQISQFAVNLLGTIYDRAAGGRGGKREWRGDLKARTKRLADGYQVELQIPWNAMNYPQSSDPRDVTINFWRLHGRLNTWSGWSFTTQAKRPEMEGIWKGVILPHASTSRRPQYLAYALSDWAYRDGKMQPRAGLDVRYPLTSQLTAVGSLYPDFKNIEQAVQSVQFTRTEQNLGDSRPFFQEGRDAFNTSSDFGIGNMFYSRRIQSFDFGAKTYGAINPKLSMGALATVGPSGTRDGLLVINKQMNAFGKLRLFGTSHRDPSVQDDLIGGWANQRFGNWSAFVEGARHLRNGQRGEAFGYSLDFKVPHFFVTARYTSISPTFDPYLGLIGFNDYRGNYVYMNHGDEQDKGYIRKVDTELYWANFRHFDGRPYQQGYDLFHSFTTADDCEFGGGVSSNAFEGVPDVVYSVFATVGANNRFRSFSIQRSVGQRDGLPYRFTQLSGTLRVLKKVDMGLSIAKDELGESQNQLVGTIGYEFDAKRSVTGRIVTSNSKTNWYLAYRSSGFRGNEWFVILGDPNGVTFRPRIAVKVVVPF